MANLEILKIELRGTMDFSMFTVVGPKCCNVNMSNLSKDIPKYLKIIVAIAYATGAWWLPKVPDYLPLGTKNTR